MPVYDDKPWLARYDEGQPAAIEAEFPNALAMFAATVARDPDADAIRYFDGRIGWRRLDEMTDAFAAGILAEGFAAGERLAIFAQNVPQFVVAQIGTWKGRWHRGSHQPDEQGA